MANIVTITPNIERIKKWLENVVNNPESRRRVLIRGSLELKDKYIVYPADGPWNREPGTRGKGIWYQRKFGTRYRKKDGTLGRSGKPSENLQVSWKYEVGADDYSASVYTPVSYAPYLYDPEQRVGWAASHGWKTVDEIADAYAPRLLEIVEMEIDHQLDKPV